MDDMFRPLRKYATFTGRALRREYWLFYLFSIIVSVAAAIVDTALEPSSIDDAENNGPMQVVAALGLLIPSIAVAVRRLHDIGRSGWYVLLPLAALPLFILMLIDQKIGIALGALAFLALVILQLVWLCRSGTPGPNRFGENPIDGAETMSV